VERYSDTPEVELRSDVARALIRKGICLGTLDRTDEELGVYDFVVEHYSESELPAEIAFALFNKAYRLSTLKQSDAAIALYDRIINTAGDSTELELKDLAVNSRYNKGFVMSSLNRHEEALTFLREIIDLYGTATEPALQEHVGRTFNGMAFESIVVAKAFRLQGNEEASLEKLHQAEQFILKALEIDGDRAMRLGNHAYILFLLGRKDEAKELLTQAIDLGGEKIRQDELKDAYVNELPEDAEFRQLVNSIPGPPIE
jgi:tetratricopeptide (TPR) repeat protein